MSMKGIVFGTTVSRDSHHVVRNLGTDMFLAS
jgi:hypothetical protein